MLSRFGGAWRRDASSQRRCRRIVEGYYPGIQSDALVGAVRFHDAQIDDARHTVAVARTARRSRCSDRHSDRCRSAYFRRRAWLAQSFAMNFPAVRFDVRARVVPRAAGVWTDDLLEMAGGGLTTCCSSGKASISLFRVRAFRPPARSSPERQRVSCSCCHGVGIGSSAQPTPTTQVPRSEPQVDEADVGTSLPKQTRIETCQTADP